MKFSDLPLNPTPRILRQFAAAWLVVFLVVAIRAFARGHHVAAYAFATISLAGLIGLLKPITIRWLFLAAIVVAFPVGWVMTQLMLIIMFFLILTPIAFVFRWRGRDELQLKHKPNQSSYWIERKEEISPEKYLKQF
ncbi:MAG TPA: SxtJ family membrane protein [Verrucomicrobiae bacterium]|nr:SxtJ family membrane protein [Verrucomicrobiae bacterium]